MIVWLLSVGIQRGEAEAFGAPWGAESDRGSISAEQQAAHLRRDPSHPPVPSSIQSWPREVITWLMHGFQTYLSPLDGPRCTVTPTCSSYSRQAIAKHGTLLGLLLTFDRLLHEFDEPARTTGRYRDGQWVGEDSLAANDWWFAELNPGK